MSKTSLEICSALPVFKAAHFAHHHRAILRTITFRFINSNSIMSKPSSYRELHLTNASDSSTHRVYSMLLGKDSSVPQSLLSQIGLHRTQTLRLPFPHETEPPSALRPRPPPAEALVFQSGIVLSGNRKFSSPRSPTLQRIRESRRPKLKPDRRSRDLSHVFDCGRYSHTLITTYCNPDADPEESSDPSKLLQPALPDLIPTLGQTSRRAISQLKRPPIERHVMSIYRNPEIMRNRRLLDGEAKKLHDILTRNSSKFRDHSPAGTWSFCEDESQGRIPPAALGAPANRTQVEMLAEWLQSTTEKINADKTLAEDETVERLMTANKFALLEVNRQVSVECVERGDLMKRITDNYMLFSDRYHHKAVA